MGKSRKTASQVLDSILSDIGEGKITEEQLASVIAKHLPSDDPELTEEVLFLIRTQKLLADKLVV